ncbi:hypothetical protein FA95DRAFT_868582 [Auriscalpium vulgare]|uniref:Uncharacterized protein n=1 Tax=Auriscalpium vulgare TaxID=40419 RepID=A0ACB8R8J4_9AGAM|nr:hypothetical protein FA95DRAFT_868582 [Auriscalpium vulgare]
MRSSPTRPVIAGLYTAETSPVLSPPWCAVLSQIFRECNSSRSSPKPLGTQNATNFTAPYAASEHNSTNGTIGDIAKSNSAFTQAVPSLFVGLALAAVAAAMQIVA